LNHDKGHPLQPDDSLVEGTIADEIAHLPELGGTQASERPKECSDQPDVTLVPISVVIA
jgi:hypothetical protein